MECQVCKTRSSVGYCEETRDLVCEVCSVSCYKCGKLLRKDVAHKSERSGHLYCAACWEEREARRGNRKSAATAEGGTSFEALMGGAPDEDPEAAAIAQKALEGEDEDGERRVLTASAWRPPPPWKLSFQAAFLGLAAILFVYLFPSFYRVQLPGGGEILTPYILLVVPTLAIVWGVVGIMSMDYMADKTRCAVGIFVGCLTAALCLAALRTDPAEKATADLVQTQYLRDSMTEDQLRAWRETVLERHRR